MHYSVRDYYKNLSDVQKGVLDVLVSGGYVEYKEGAFIDAALYTNDGSLSKKLNKRTVFNIFSDAVFSFVIHKKDVPNERIGYFYSTFNEDFCTKINGGK